jgi:molecular chaperone DnaK (HSP70)
LVGCQKGYPPIENVTFIDNVKRLMGRDFDDTLTHELGYKTTSMPDGKVGIQCHGTGSSLTVAEVSSEILKVR